MFAPFDDGGGVGIGFPIDIPGSQIGSGTHTDIPIYINQSNFPNSAKTLSGALACANGGGDLRVYLSSPFGTRLALEVVRCSLNAAPASSLIDLWVKVPSLVSGVAAKIWIVYRIPGQTAQPIVSDTYGRNNVWSANYKTVLHMNDAIGTMVDSTGLGNTFTDVNAPTLVSAKCGQGRTYNGSTQGSYLNAPATDLQFTSAYTMQLWANDASIPGAGYKTFASRQFGAGGADSYVMYGNSADAPDLTGAGRGPLSYGVDFSVGVSRYFVQSKNGASERVFLNGALANSTAGAATPLNNDANEVVVGAGINGAGVALDEHYNGTLDEVHFSNVQRADGWVLTQYNNQNAPATFAPGGVVQLL